MGQVEIDVDERKGVCLVGDWRSQIMNWRKGWLGGNAGSLKLIQGAG
jgi:hypothetical protein